MAKATEKKGKTAPAKTSKEAKETKEKKAPVAKAAPVKAAAKTTGKPGEKKPAKAVNETAPAPEAAPDKTEADEAAPKKARGPRKTKKVEEPTGTVIGSPRLAGLRRAPGVRDDQPAPAPAPAPKPKADAQKSFTKKDLQEIKQKLLAMREANLANLRKKLEEDHERSVKLAADPVDQASDACDEDISLEIASTKDEQLQLINTALENIDNGTYGTCIMCGEKIPITRLKVLPFVVRCKDCKAIYEKTRRAHDANWSLVSGGGMGGNEDGDIPEPVEE